MLTPSKQNRMKYLGDSFCYRCYTPSKASLTGKAYLQVRLMCKTPKIKKNRSFAHREKTLRLVSVDQSR